ncbi:MAG: hypothetical protein KDA65_06120 [Planctomycetaceae bacterium]|nr:hypothetical protein [Planctomycetaceae bacterium]
MPSRFVLFSFIFVFFLGNLTGCSKEQILGWFGDSETVPVTTKPGTPTSSTPKSPFFSMEVNPAIKTNSCYAKFDKFDSGTRPNILRIKSYETVEDETFPSFLIYAQVTEPTLGSLVDKEINANFYAAHSEEGTVYHHIDGEGGVKLKIKITEITGDGIAGTFTGGNIAETYNETPQNARGSFYARIQP